MSVTPMQMQTAKDALQTYNGDRQAAQDFLSIKRAWSDTVSLRAALDAAEADLKAKEISMTAATVEEQPIVSTAPGSEHASVERLDAGKPTNGKNPLTEQELVETVRFMADEDSVLEPSDRMTIDDIVEIFEDMGKKRGSEISVPRIREIIAEHYANPATAVKPTAVEPTTSKPKTTKSVDCPKELIPLFESGVARLDGKDWLVNRCSVCGQFKSECCGPIRTVAATSDGTLTSLGRQAVGLDPIRKPAAPKSNEQIKEEQKERWPEETWWHEFSGVGELAGNGKLKFYINNLLPEGIFLLCGPWKVGKSFLALEMVKSLTTGEPFLQRPEYGIPEKVPVLWLAGESKDGGLKLRCQKFGITEDKRVFISRTLSKGPMLGLDDEKLLSAVKAMKPVIVLETLVRFHEGDEDSASDNKEFSGKLFHLLAVGARSIVVIHHPRKDYKSDLSMEAAARGSGDILAMPDAMLKVTRDERLYRNNTGPNELDVVGWGRDFTPSPFRVALTGKAPDNLPPGTLTWAPGIISYADAEGGLRWVEKKAAETQRQERQELDLVVEGLVTEAPSIARKTLAEKAGVSEWEIRGILKRLGYNRTKDGPAGEWVKSSGEPAN